MQRFKRASSYKQVESEKSAKERCSRVAAIVIAIQEGSTNIWVEKRGKRLILLATNYNIRLER